MSKTTFNLKIVTPYGEFTRKATKAYTHAVVRTSPRAMEAYETRGTNRHATGVYARWVKDRGFAVTWHGSLQAAKNAAAKPYLWDAKDCGQGEVFAVGAPATDPGAHIRATFALQQDANLKAEITELLNQAWIKAMALSKKGDARNQLLSGIEAATNAVEA